MMYLYFQDHHLQYLNLLLYLNYYQSILNQMDISSTNALTLLATNSSSFFTSLPVLKNQHKQFTWLIIAFFINPFFIFLLSYIHSSEFV